MNTKDYIKTRRMELNLSQLDVATQVGVSEATVSRWESGDIANMGASRITALAKVLETSPLLILGDIGSDYENVSHSTLQERIKSQRLAKGLTLLEISEQLGVKEATVQRYESGEIKNIKHETISALADILGCSPGYLMGWETDAKPTASTPFEKLSNKKELAELTPSQLADIEKIVTLYQSASPEKKKLVEDLLNLAEQEQYNSDDG